MFEEIESIVDAKMSHISHANDKNLALHSIEVARRLLSLGCSQKVIKAGYFHSAYGREFTNFQALGWGERSWLCDLIGQEAEELCYLNCIMKNKSFWLNFHEKKVMGSHEVKLINRLTGELIPVSTNDFLDLLLINLVNMLDHIDNTRPISEFKSPEVSLFIQHYDYLPEKAQLYFKEKLTSL